MGLQIIHYKSVTIIVLDRDPWKHEPIVRPGVDDAGYQESEQQIHWQTDRPNDHHPS